MAYVVSKLDLMSSMSFCSAFIVAPLKKGIINADITLDIKVWASPPNSILNMV